MDIIHASKVALSGSPKALGAEQAGDLCAKSWDVCCTPPMFSAPEVHGRCRWISGVVFRYTCERADTNHSADSIHLVRRKSCSKRSFGTRIACGRTQSVIGAGWYLAVELDRFPSKTLADL